MSNNGNVNMSGGSIHGPVVGQSTGPVTANYTYNYGSI